MSGRSSPLPPRAARFVQAAACDLALALHIAVCLVFVVHALHRGYDLLDRNGYFDPPYDFHVGHVAYYQLARGIEPGPLKHTTAFLFGQESWLEPAGGQSAERLGVLPIYVLIGLSVAAAGMWSALGYAGIFASPGQRVFGLAPAREVPPDEMPPPRLKTFGGAFGLGVVLLTFAAGWLMVEVRVTDLTSAVRIGRMSNIFAEMLDFSRFQANWSKAIDGDPKTTSSWDLLTDAVPKMVETVFLAMMATALAVPVAFVLAFPMARNLMDGSRGRLCVYYALRTAMNVVRSIEPLAWCIIASVWVGAGSFAGVLALAVHSVASLTKMYSEFIEAVEPGPIEAIRATGASGLQLLRFGVVPQIVPPFLSYTMYRWDINVRMAPILGFVGGGGIGVLLKQNFDLSHYANVGIIIFLITVLVAAMDFASAHLRARLA